MANIAGYKTAAPEQWTPAEEERFVEMSNRRARVLEARRDPVVALAISMQHDFCDGEFQKAADWLIHRADEIRDILAPFDSGVRPSKEG